MKLVINSWGVASAGFANRMVTKRQTALIKVEKAPDEMRKDEMDEFMMMSRGSFNSALGSWSGGNLHPPEAFGIAS